MAEQWYVSRDGKQSGPMTLEQLQAGAASGNVRPTDFVWKEGMAGWVGAQEIAGLFPTSASASMANPYSSPAVLPQGGASTEPQPTNPFGWYVRVLQNFAQFSGRARRKEYWFFTLFNALIAIVLRVVDLATIKSEGPYGILVSIYVLAMFIPGLAVTVRRLHDTGRSGWWFLVAFIPFVGGIILLIFMVEDSKPGDNAYGPNPKMPGEW